MDPMDDELAAARILVALDDAGAALDALPAAAVLASRLRAELFGLYVEDIDLLRLAGLPFARSVGHSSAREQPLDFEGVERAFRRQAERMRELLEEAAERERLAWSFRVSRGRLLETMMEQAGRSDLLVFYRPRRAAAPHRGLARSVAVLLRQVGEVRQVLDVGLHLARSGGGELVVLAADPALRAPAETWLEGHRARARFVPLPDLSLALPEAVAREAATALVMGSDDGIEPALAGALEQVGCPVVVCRVSGAE